MLFHLPQSAISEEPDLNSVNSAHDVSGDSAVSTASALSSIDGMANDNHKVIDPDKMLRNESKALCKITVQNSQPFGLTDL